MENLLEKIVKVGSRWQVQSEKGRNLGTYDTKEEAEERLKQVEYFKHINEAYETSDFCLGTAGYIKDDGSLILLDEYHGEEPDLWKERYIEFSNTHPEEDTCIRLFKRPTKEQYKRLEEIIDRYLVTEDYCKIEFFEVENNNSHIDSYNIYSLYEGACEDTQWNENVGNWTGYKLVQIIKNYYNLNEELLLELNRGQLINKSKSSDKYKSKGRENENRWTRRNKSQIAQRVDQYNKIDMNDFFKRDELKVGINVHGETDDYVVLIRYDGALREIAEQIKRNNNKLEFKCVLIALQRVFNQGNVFVSCTCLHPSTKIKLLDGTIPTIEEMKNRFDNGEELWVYSTDSQGDFKPGKVESVWITKTTTHFIEVTLDNNEKIITTPEHLYMLRTGEYIQAKDLRENDSLMPMYFNSSNGYETIKLNSEERGWRSTYKLVAENLKQAQIKEKELEALTDGSQDFTYTVAIHHKDFHRRNNNPSNLVPLTAKEHWYLHAHQVFEERSEEAKENIRKLASERAKIKNANPTEKMIQSRKNFVEKGRLRNYDEDRKAQQREVMSKAMKEYYENISEYKLNDIKRKRIEGHKQAVKNGCLKTDKFHKAALERGKQMHTPERQKLITAGVRRYYADPKNREARHKQNLETMILKSLKYLTDNHLELTEENYEAYRKTRNGYPKITTRFKDINEAVSYFNLNHKVISVKQLTLEETPVYDITVKDWNNFVVDSGVVLHNCADWKYRQAYSATKDGYNSGIPELRASDITNPHDTKGAGCKHVNLVLGNVDWLMKVSSVINNYIHYMKDTYEQKYADLIFPKLFNMPYQKAVQLDLIDDTENLPGEEDVIQLSNKYGRERTRFGKYREPPNVKHLEQQPIEEKPEEPKLELNLTKKVEEIKDDLGVDAKDEVK